MTFTSIILGLPFTFVGDYLREVKTVCKPSGLHVLLIFLLMPFVYVWNKHSISWLATSASILPLLLILHNCSHRVPICHQNLLDMLSFFSNVVDSHCYTLQCRRIDCEQLRSSINEQLIVGHFGHEGFISCMQNFFFSSGQIPVCEFIQLCDGGSLQYQTSPLMAV